MQLINNFLAGNKLHGDSFSLPEIEAWYDDEKEGYHDLTSKATDIYQYQYHEQNKLLGYNYLNSDIEFSCLSIGGAYAHELIPIRDRLKDITVIEPSQNLRSADLCGIPLRYIDPQPNGVINLQQDSFDLVTCFGVLHHIPNVSFVLSEIFRVLRPGGMLLLREPIVSMGDWSKPRPGLTARERGIPLKILKESLMTSGFNITRLTMCCCKPFDKFFSDISGIDSYNSTIYVRIDILLSRLFTFNYSYHPSNIIKKIRPTSAFILVTKPFDWNVV